MNEIKKYTFDEAKDTILEALKPLGKTYIEDISKMFSNRSIDKYPNDGKRSGAEYLSSGEMTLCALAYRLAITDNIFEGKEKPFLILDDIFADLDETHIHMAKKFMESLSQNEQILYFTCHPSRDMK